MTEEERRRYLVESLFLNSVTYENEMLDAYMRRLTAPRKKGRGARPAGGQLKRRCSWPALASWPARLLSAARPAPGGRAHRAWSPTSFDFGHVLTQKDAAAGRPVLRNIGPGRPRDREVVLDLRLRGGEGLRRAW